MSKSVQSIETALMQAGFTSGACMTILAMLQNDSQRGHAPILSDASGTLPPPLLQREDFPKVTYWTEDEWTARQGKGTTLLRGKCDYSTAAKCNYIETADGQSPTEAEWKAMHNAARAAFNGLESAPDSWMTNSSTNQRVAVYKTLIKSFPFLGYCNGYWKVKKYIVNQYPLWKKAQKDKFDAENLHTRKTAVLPVDATNRAGNAQARGAQIEIVGKGQRRYKWR